MPPPSVSPPTPVCEIWPAGHGEPVPLGGGVELAEQGAAADADGLGFRVDVDRVERAQVDAERAVPDRAPGDGVPAAADRELQAAGAGGTNRRGDVVGVGRVGDRGRTAIDRAVPARAGAVVVGIAGVDDAADEAGRSRRAGDEGGGGGGGGHGATLAAGGGAGVGGVRPRPEFRVCAFAGVGVVEVTVRSAGANR